jgi:hypothetical protein
MMHGMPAWNGAALDGNRAVAKPTLRELIQRPVGRARGRKSDVAIGMREVLPDFVISRQHSDVRYFLL